MRDKDWRLSMKCGYVVYMLGAFVAAFLLANFFTYFYFNVATGITNPNRYTKVKRETREYNFFAKEGFGITKTDKNGFYNDGKVTPEAAEVLCIGSSQTEAVHVHTENNWVSQINILNPRLNAYNLGISGQSIIESLYRLPYLPAFFPKCKVIICETTGLGSLEAWKKVLLYLENNDAPVKNVDWKRDRLIGRIYFSFPYFELINDNIAAVTAKESYDSISSYDLRDYREVVNRALQLVRERLGDMPLVIVYLPRIRLEPDGHITITNDDELQKIMKEACEVNHILYVHNQLSSSFINDYEAYRILPYGFMNSHIGQGHLNTKGHRLVAEVLYKILQEEGIGQ